jgi:phage-related baseplate assembly protein
VTTIDLTAIEPPDVLETLDFEEIYQDLLEYFKSIYPDWSAALESDPVVKLIELAAYREVRFRARANDAARSVMLAFATGTTLEHLAALFGIKRLTVRPADPDSGDDELKEKDDDLRSRTQLAPQGYSVAGPEGAYRSHALNADGRVLSVSVTSPAPCEIVVTILSREGDGTASDELVGIVTKALQAEDVSDPSNAEVLLGSRPLGCAGRVKKARSAVCRRDAPAGYGSHRRRPVRRDPGARRAEGHP